MQKRNLVLVTNCSAVEVEIMKSKLYYLSMKYKATVDAPAQLCSQQWRMMLARFH